MKSGIRVLWFSAAIGGVFLLLNLLFDGFPYTWLDRVSTKYPIGLPPGTTYAEWHRGQFGTDPEPPRVVYRQPAVVKNAAVLGCALAAGAWLAIATRRKTSLPPRTLRLPPQSTEPSHSQRT